MRGGFSDRDDQITEAAFGVAGEDRLAICLAAVDDDTIRSAMARNGFAEESCGCRQVTVLQEKNSTVSPTC
jgi:hypothetical protein